MSVSEDMNMLRRLVAEGNRREESDEEEHPNLQDHVRRAFADILSLLENGLRQSLSERQRAWVRDVYDRVFDEPLYENLASSGKLARGREVKLLVDDMPKPKKPPQRRSIE